MYVEFCKGIKDRGNIIPFSAITPEYRNYDAYFSLFPFEENVNSYINIHKTIKGYCGKHYLPVIAIDIDNENTEKSQQDTILAVKKINKLYNINIDELYIYFSGSKGFHVLIPEKIYGNQQPQENISLKVKRFIVEKFSDIESVDTKIYEDHRIFRVANSKHQKTGLYKIQISFEELNLPIEEIKNIAKKPRVFTRKETPRYNDGFSRDLSIHLNSDIKEDVVIKNTSDNFFAPAKTGSRNQKLFYQAQYFFKTTEINREGIFNILSSINYASQNPIDKDELKQLILSAESYAPKNNFEEIKAYTFTELIDIWKQDNNLEKRKIDLLFKSLNKEFGGKLRGKMGGIVGYGGSKKSLFAQLVSLVNAKNGLSSIYSNMEMGVSALMDRYIDMIAESSKPFYNASKELSELYQQENIDIDNHLLEISKITSNKIHICQNSSMTAEKYRKLINKTEEENGKVDILIVDGLSMMGGKGTETENYTQNSKELKDLSKDYNILVLLILHASKGEKLETKDLSRNVRASEKIMDNVDWIMTMSQDRDLDNYINTRGFYNLWNKRGTGNRIEKMFSFNEQNLFMEEQDDTF